MACRDKGRQQGCGAAAPALAPLRCTTYRDGTSDRQDE